MEFAEWVVSGLDQLRAGQLPGGQGLYEAVSSGLGGSAAVDAYMNTGDAAARAELVQTIAQAVAANPAFEQQLRQAADGAQSTQNTQTAGLGAGGDATKPSFFKTTNGMLVAVGLAVAVIGGGIGLGVGLSGDGGSGLAALLKGTWSCTSGPGASGSLTIGDGTWNVGGTSGTWKQNGSSVTLTNTAEPGDDIVGSGLPSGAGPFDIAVHSVKKPGEAVAHIKGTVSAHKITVSLASSDESPSTVTCTK